MRSALITLLFVVFNSVSFADTVLVGTFFNGNNAALNSRAYLWNPTTDDADITARVYTLPLTGPSTLLGVVSLGLIHSRSGKNIKIAEEILFKIGIFLPYLTGGGNVMVEFTVGADNVRGTGQVFGPDLAFGTYPLEVMPAPNSGVPLVRGLEVLKETVVIDQSSLAGAVRVNKAVLREDVVKRGVLEGENAVSARRKRISQRTTRDKTTNVGTRNDTDPARASTKEAETPNEPSPGPH